MTKAYYPTSLKFSYDVEYSTDGGTSYTALAANTDANIPSSAIPADGIIKIRSTSDDATSISASGLALDDRMVDWVNIRNGKKLTSLSNMFKNRTLDKVRVHNTPELTSISYMFEDSRINQVILPHMPKVSYLYQTFKGAYIKEISDIKAKDNGELDLGGTFNGSHINLIGEIFFPTNGGTSYHENNMEETFYSATIELFPNMDIISRGTNSGNKVKSMFRNLNTKYMLTNKNHTMTKLSYDYLTGNSGYYDSYSSMNNSKMFFAGLDVYTITKMMGAHTEHFARSCPNLESLFSKWVSPATGGNYDYLHTSSFYNCPNFDQSKISLLERHNMHDVVEDLNWLPKFKELDRYTMSTRIANGITSTVNNRIVKIEDGNKYVAKWADKHNTDLIFNEPTAHGLASNSVWFSRDGKYAVQDGADIKCYLADGTAAGTISSVTANHGQMNADGSKFYVVTGAVIDKANTANQTVTSTISAYNTSDGSQVFTHNMNNVQNEEARGVYCPNDDSYVNVLMSVYADTNGTMRAASSNVLSMKADGTIDLTTALSEPAIELVPSFAESAEFVGLNNHTNKAIRMFAS